MRRATQAEVAALAGVSQATVSHVLNGAASPRKRVSEHARRKVLDAMEAVGYVGNPMAQGLASGRSRILGVFTYESVFPRDGSSFFHPFLVGMEAEAEHSGLDLLMFTSAPLDGGRRRLADAGWNRLAIADGCVLIGRHTDRNEVAWLMERNYPFVFIGRRQQWGERQVPFVGADYVAATASLTTRMLEAGHMRIAFVGDLSGATSATDRVHGYREVMKEAELRPILFDHGAFSPEETIQILQDHRVTAALFGSQVDSAAVAAAAQAAGVSIPEDLSVALLGDPDGGHSPFSHWARFTIPRAEMGAEAIRILRAIIEDDEDTELTRVMPCQEIKGTTIIEAKAK